VSLDDDGQHSPAEALRLWQMAVRRDLDVVFGRYANRHHPWWRRQVSSLHNVVARRLLHTPDWLTLSSFKVVSRFAMNEILRYRGPTPFIDALLLRATHRIGQLDVLHLPRASGRSNYTVTRLLRLWADFVVGYTSLPARLALWLGSATTTAGLALMAACLSSLLDKPGARAIEPWVLISAFALAAGVQLLILAGIADAVRRLLAAQGGAPQFVVRRTIMSPEVADARQPLRDRGVTTCTRP
jgi:undecaprenyl-phosphate 4-deoxy-4-formamido-L-arabinose transferase